ncbi:hypothetical protein N7510_007404 [Penicillium lagena]|uniref:uncharacterized protein n=1 Tax=Penicillium lagena TaxID=94218 RepID=UPI002542306A|nr:uncharacterized protein N7510_007404 [Penicillium lagena]KAJ5610685.1 hypothetical protein N7510_007404 [Penicillium lagena]
MRRRNLQPQPCGKARRTVVGWKPVLSFLQLGSLFLVCELVVFSIRAPIPTVPPIKAFTPGPADVSTIAGESALSNWPRAGSCRKHLVGGRYGVVEMPVQYHVVPSQRARIGTLFIASGDTAAGDDRP